MEVEVDSDFRTLVRPGLRESCAKWSERRIGTVIEK